MTARIEISAPPDDDARRAGLYAGRIFKLAPTTASLRLADAATGLLARELGGADVRRLAMSMPPERLFEAVGRVRLALYTGKVWHEALRGLLAACGCDPSAYAFDPLRLRTVLHRGHETPAASAVYVHHRDTWYAHPQAVITGWTPLDDLEAEETFVFYPERFATSVPNDSETFDYDRWVQDGSALKIGWQDRAAGRQARYPAMTGGADPGKPECGESELGPALGFSCRRGELLLFSGAHLHATLPQATGRARFSLDFRMAHLGDVAAGLGAPNADNRSTGSAFGDYVGGASPAARAETRARFSAKPPGTTS